MAKFPTYQRRVGLQGGPTASYASGEAFAAPARALQGLGNTLQGVGDEFAAKQQKIQNSQDDVWFSKARAETAMEIGKFDNEARQAATGDAAGYQEGVLQQYSSIRDQRLANAPSDRARSMYEEWSNGYQATIYGQTGAFRAQSELAKRNDDFAGAMLAHTQTVYDNPDQYDVIRKRVMDDLEGAKQWMTPEQEITARTKVERELQLARAKGDILRDPKAFLNSVGITGAVNVSFSPAVNSAIDTAASKYGVPADALRVIAQIESKGNPNAKNPTSSAGGLFQQIDSNAKQYGVSDKFDPNQSADGAARFMRDNTKVLRAVLGRDPNIGELYLAHQQGPGGASKLLASPSAKAVDIVGADAVRLNGGRSDMTAREFANLWIDKANKIAGGDTAPSFNDNPAYANLSVDDMIGLSEEAQRRIAQSNTRNEADLKSAMAQVKGAFELGIATGDPGVTRQSILTSPLKDADKAGLISSLETKRKDEIAARDYAQKIAGDSGFNAYDEKDKKGIGLVYDAATNGASLYGDDGKARAMLEYLYGRSGIVPKTAASELRSGLVSGDPAKVAVAASIAARLAGDNPAGLTASEGGSDLAKAAATYRHLTDALGLDSKEAGQRMVDMADPEKAKQREAILESKTVKDKLKAVDETAIRDIWDTWGPNSITGYTVGATEEAKSVMVTEYKGMLEESIVEAAGDMDLAEELAAQKFKRVYAPSPLSLSGEDVITKLPPEVTYPPGPDGTHDYIREQLQDRLRESGVMFDDGEVFLQTRPDTMESTRAGAPKYDVYYYSDGKLEKLQGFFIADPSKASDVAVSESAARFEANRMRETQRQKQIESFGKPGTTPLEEMDAAKKKFEQQLNEPLAKGATPDMQPGVSGGGGF